MVTAPSFPQPWPHAGLTLSTRELVERARRLRLVLTDCDGVLTDACVYLSARGEEMKRFSLRDGMGVERLREAGIETAILTRERSPIVARRVEKLCLRHHFEGVADKRACLPRIVAETGAAAHEIAFIGDDLNDVELLLEVAKGGLTGAPADAMPRVAQLAHHQGRAAGGAGAFREFAEWILRLRGAERPDGRGEAA